MFTTKATKKSDISTCKTSITNGHFKLQYMHFIFRLWAFSLSKYQSVTIIITHITENTLVWTSTEIMYEGDQIPTIC